MDVQQRRKELAFNILAAIREKFLRDTGMEVECYVTEDASAVCGSLRERGQFTRFTIPVVVVQEYHPGTLGDGNMAAGVRGPVSPAAERQEDRRC